MIGVLVQTIYNSKVETTRESPETKVSRQKVDPLPLESLPRTHSIPSPWCLCTPESKVTSLRYVLRIFTFYFIKVV